MSYLLVIVAAAGALALAFLRRSSTLHAGTGPASRPPVPNAPRPLRGQPPELEIP